MTKKLIGLSIIVGGIGVLGWIAYTQQPRGFSQETTSSSFLPGMQLPTLSDAVRHVITRNDTQQLVAATIPDVDPSFTFTSTMPSNWKAAALPELQALNLYDSTGPGTSSLEQSQIFIRQFTANSFLTLATVDVLETTELTIAGRPARRYEIIKKATIPPFSNQPQWRNQQHIVTDIRVSDANPSVFYVIAKRPELDDKTYQTFLDNFELASASAVDTAIVEPIAEFSERITKKPFGIFITPDTSPVQPERFRGFHTAVDVEYEDIAGDVPVHAVADGTVRVARTASGYGGVIVLEHQQFTTLYGHLDPARLPSVGQKVSAGEALGFLGTGGTAETDGERKHLHFGVRRGTDVNLSGYVSSEAELQQWIDPLELFN